MIQNLLFCVHDYETLRSTYERKSVYVTRGKKLVHVYKNKLNRRNH